MAFSGMLRRVALVRTDVISEDGNLILFKLEFVCFKYYIIVKSPWVLFRKQIIPTEPPPSVDEF
jgi:hypothetical protein